MLLDNGFFSFAKLSGFQIDVASMPDKCSVKKLFQNMKEYCTIGRNGKSITMSMEELNAFENELCDYVEFRLQHMMK